MNKPRPGDPRLPGALELLRRYRRIAVGRELVLSLAAAVVAAAYYVPGTTGNPHEALLGVIYAELQSAAALLGIVLAALAVVVAFLADEYVMFLTLDSNDPLAVPHYDELHRLIFFFWLTCILAVMSVVACLVSVWWIGGGGSPAVAASVSTGFFLWALLAALGLVRFVANHLLIRSAHINKVRQAELRRATSPGGHDQPVRAEDDDGEVERGEDQRIDSRHEGSAGNR